MIFCPSVRSYESHSFFSTLLYLVPDAGRAIYNCPGTVDASGRHLKKQDTKRYTRTSTQFKVQVCLEVKGCSLSSRCATPRHLGSVDDPQVS